MAPYDQQAYPAVPSSKMDFVPNAVGEAQPQATSGRRMLPQNIEAEKSVLAACMLTSEALVEAVSRLVPEDFFRPSHRIIFAAMMDLNSRNVAIDQISLAENLHGTGQLESVGGKAYLADLSDNTFALTNWRTHVEVIKRTSILRNLIFASAKITALAYDAPDDLNAVVEDAEKILFDVTEKRISSDFVEIKSLLVQTFDEIAKLADQRDTIAGVPTGFKDVDALFHGWRGGDLIILAARPGVGKTSFALNIATNAAKLGVTVAFLSLEMGASQLVQRILCSEARVNLGKLRAGQVSEAD